MASVNVKGFFFLRKCVMGNFCVCPAALDSTEGGIFSFLLTNKGLDGQLSQLHVVTLFRTWCQLCHRSFSLPFPASCVLSSLLSLISREKLKKKKIKPQEWKQPLT